MHVGKRVQGLEVPRGVAGEGRAVRMRDDVRIDGDKRFLELLVRALASGPWPDDFSYAIESRVRCNVKAGGYQHDGCECGERRSPTLTRSCDPDRPTTRVCRNSD